MFTAFQCAQFASCMGGHKNYDEYEVSDKEAGSSPNNPIRNNNGGFFTSFIVIAVITIIGWFGYNFIADNNLFVDEEVAVQVPSETLSVEGKYAYPEGAVSISYEQERAYVLDGKINTVLLVKSLYNDGSEKIDTLTVRQSLSNMTNWESVK